MSQCLTKQLMFTGLAGFLLTGAGGYTVHAKASGPLPTLNESLTGASGLDAVRDAAAILRLSAPIPGKFWDDALPLGNGLLGGLLYGEGSRLTLALDRGDIWDERDMPETLEQGFTFANMRDLVRKHTYQPPNSNYDHDSMAALSWGLAHMAEELGKHDDAKHWAALVAGLGERWVDPGTNILGIAPGRRFGGSHRHMSHLMSIFPYASLNIEGSEADRKVIAASLNALEEKGTARWTGYSFSWVACLMARAGNADAALKYLNTYCNEYTSRNGFHMNGNRKKGTSPFTLEGSFMAMEAVHEMLMQSWGGTIRVFPALPDAWKNVSFRDLRAEGGFAVSASRKAGETQWVGVRSLAGRPCRINLGLKGKVQVDSSAGNVKLEAIGDGLYELDLRKGDEAILYVGKKPLGIVRECAPLKPPARQSRGTCGPQGGRAGYWRGVPREHCGHARDAARTARKKLWAVIPWTPRNSGGSKRASQERL